MHLKVETNLLMNGLQDAAVEYTRKTGITYK